MAQENLSALTNLGDEMEEQTRVQQAPISNTTAISGYRSVAGSSGILRTEHIVTTVSSPSSFQSQRIQSMIDNRRNFSSEAEFDMEYSRDHWSELTGSDTDSSSTRLSNREHFEALKNHPEWGGFFKDVKVQLGEKINEGAQAEIYDAKVEFEDGRKSPDYGYHVVKVMKGDCPLGAFQRQWPVGMLCNASKDRVKGPLMWIQCGTLIEDSFAFVMLRQWGDLRKLIDLKMQLQNNQGPPFDNYEFVRKMMLCIARDMEALHDKYGIIHRDLKASNVLLWSFGEGLPDDNPHVKANVVDYECSVGVVGTGYWRAPEILQQLKDEVPASKLKFSKMCDVYSYAMTCYELLTGRMPFEEHESARDYDLILKESRPELFDFDDLRFDFYWIESIVKECWRDDPYNRPTFSEIVRLLGAYERCYETCREKSFVKDELVGTTVQSELLRRVFKSIFEEELSQVHLRRRLLKNKLELEERWAWWELYWATLKKIVPSWGSIRPSTMVSTPSGGAMASLEEQIPTLEKRRPTVEQRRARFEKELASLEEELASLQE